MGRCDLVLIIMFIIMYYKSNEHVTSIAQLEIKRPPYKVCVHVYSIPYYSEGSKLVLIKL